jgi:hypothetical protein
VGRLVGRDHVAHRIPEMGTKEKWTVQTDRNATQKYTTIYCQKCDVDLCLGHYFEIYPSKVTY